MLVQFGLGRLAVLARVGAALDSDYLIIRQVPLYIWPILNIMVMNMIVHAILGCRLAYAKTRS